jgi:hypothetical protein
VDTVEQAQPKTRRRHDRDLKNKGKFVWPQDATPTMSLSRAQFDALVLGLPWQRVGEAGIIRVL